MTYRTRVWLFVFYLLSSVAATALWFPLVSYDCGQQTKAGGYETAITLIIRPLLWRFWIALCQYCVCWGFFWWVTNNTPWVDLEWKFWIKLLILLFCLYQYYYVWTEESEALEAKWKEVADKQKYCCDLYYEHSHLPQDERKFTCNVKKTLNIIWTLTDMGVSAGVAAIKQQIVVESWRFTLKSCVTLIEELTPYVAVLCLICSCLEVVFSLGAYCVETDDARKSEKWNDVVLAWNRLLTMMKEFVTSVVRRRVPGSLTSAGVVQPQLSQPALGIEPPKPAAESGHATAAHPTPPSVSPSFFERIRNHFFRDKDAAVDETARRKAEEDAAEAARLKKAEDQNAAAAKAARLKKAEDQKANDDSAAAKAARLKAEEDQKAKADAAAAEADAAAAEAASCFSGELKLPLHAVSASSDSTTLEERKKSKRVESRVSAADTLSTDVRRKDRCTWKCQRSGSCKRKRGEEVHGQPGTQYRCGEHTKKHKSNA